MMSKQPEGKVSKKIIDAVKAKGGYVWKVHGNEYTPSGTPDIVGSYRGVFVAFETKMPGNRLSSIQEYRIGRLRIAGALVVAPCFTVNQALELLTAIDDSMDIRDVIDSMAARQKLRREWGIDARFPA